MTAPKPTDPKLVAYLARREALLDCVRTILVDELRVQLPPEQIDPDVPLFGTGLALDSVDAVDLVVAVESKCNIRFPDDRTGRLALRSLNSLIDFVIFAQDLVGEVA